jgi:hypothetical protein
MTQPLSKKQKKITVEIERERWKQKVSMSQKRSRATIFKLSLLKINSSDKNGKEKKTSRLLFRNP